MGASSLQLYLKVPRTGALGPGVRFAIWVQGCPLRCVGCMTPGSLPWGGGERVAVDALAEDILAVEEIDGLTISGGEPFAQGPALAALIDAVRARRDLGVIVYTGYLVERLRAGAPAPEGDGWADLLARVDLLVDGPYVESRNDGGALRGSANQRALLLTGRYRREAALYGAPGRHVEVQIRTGEIDLVGVPGRTTLDRWRALTGASEAGAPDSAPRVTLTR